jgi:hypothetical protein
MLPFGMSSFPALSFTLHHGLFNISQPWFSPLSKENGKEIIAITKTLALYINCRNEDSCFHHDYTMCYLRVHSIEPSYVHFR